MEGCMRDERLRYFPPHDRWLRHAAWCYREAHKSGETVEASPADEFVLTSSEVMRIRGTVYENGLASHNGQVTILRCRNLCIHYAKLS